MKTDVFTVNGESNAVSSGSGFCKSPPWKSIKTAPRNPFIHVADSSGINLPNEMSYNPSFSQMTLRPSINDLPTRKKAYAYAFIPPDTSSLMKSFNVHGLPNKEYRDPFYSNSQDLPQRPREYAGRVFDLRSGTGMAFLSPWKANLVDEPVRQESMRHESCGWEYAGWPPSKRNIKLWLEKIQSGGKGVHPNVRLL